MFCNVLDIELVDKEVSKDLGGFIDGKIQGYSFRPPKKYKPTKQAFWCTRNLQLCRTAEVWITVSFQTFFLEIKRANTLQKKMEKCKILWQFIG